MAERSSRNIIVIFAIGTDVNFDILLILKIANLIKKQVSIPKLD